MRYWVLLFLTMLFLPCLAFGAGQEERVVLKVYYLEFPPYYYTDSEGQPGGFLLEKTAAVLDRAGIDAVYETMPAKRILQEMRSPEPICSIGWFKTPQRELFAKFSRAIYQNKPLKIMYLEKNASLFAEAQSLAQVLSDDSLVLGVLGGYSFGAEVDALIEKHGPPVQVVVGGYPQLVRMLAAERFTYMLVAPEEMDVLIERNGLVPGLFESKRLADIPVGNTRHLMFSRGVPSHLVDRVDQAIEHLDKDKIN